MAFLINLFYFILVPLILLALWWYLSIPSNLPPGPRGLPILGSSLSTWRASTLPRQLFEWAKNYGPLYKFYIADKLIVVLGDFDVIQETLVKQGDTFASRPHLNFISADVFKPGTGFNSDGELWKTQRRFALTTLRDFGFGRPILEPKIKEEAEYLCEEILARNERPFDPAPFLNNAVSNVICDLVFGRRFDYNDQRFHEMLRVMRDRLSETNVSMLTPFIVSKKIADCLKFMPRVKELTNLGGNMAKFLRQEIAEALCNFDPKRDEPSCYVQAFYQVQHDGKGDWTFTDDQLLTSVFHLFLAGTDTTATTIRWALFYLAHHLEWQEKVYQEILRETSSQSILLNYADRIRLPLTEATIMETQRLANLAPLGVPRRTMNDCKVNGYDIPADTIVIPLLTAVLWEDKVYSNPKQFDPARFLDATKIGEKSVQYTHLIPFLAGKRICLGESLAKMELFIFFTALLSKFKFVFSQFEPKPGMEDEKVSFIRAPPKFNICAIPRVQ